MSNIVVKDKATLEQLKTEFKQGFQEVIDEVKAEIAKKEEEKKKALQKKAEEAQKKVDESKPKVTSEDHEFLKAISSKFGKADNSPF